MNSAGLCLLEVLVAMTLATIIIATYAGGVIKLHRLNHLPSAVKSITCSTDEINKIAVKVCSDGSLLITQ